MYFEKVYLDQFLLDSLERLSIKEGWVSHETDEEPLSIIHTSPRQSDRISGRSKLLRLLMLFEKIDANFSDLDWSKFINNGIIDPDSKMLDHTLNRLHFDFLDQKTNEHRKLLTCHKETYNLLINQKKRIISYHIKKSSPGYYARGGTTTTIKDLSDAYIEILDCILKTDDTNDVFNIYPHIDSFLGDVYFVWASIRNGLYYSTKQNVTLSTFVDKQYHQVKRNNKELIDDMYYIVKTNLSDESIILPEPRCIEEAFELRSKKEMILFRSVLSEWMSMISEGGSAAAELKIRTDLFKVNNDIKRIKQWKKYKESPFDFWLNSLGGHIPVFSNILTVVNMSAGLYFSNQEKNTSWVALLQK